MAQVSRSAAVPSAAGVVRRLPVSGAQRPAFLGKSHWAGPAARAAAIGAALPFVGWPAAAQERLARAARVRAYASGGLLYRHGAPSDHVAVVVAGSVESSITAPDGRRVLFAVELAGRAYGLLPLIDALPTTNDMFFVEDGVALEIPYGAIQAELASDPALWAGVAREVNARARRFNDDLKSVLFDSLRSRAASLLLGLAQPQDPSQPGPSEIVLRLPQERFAEMLGVSRQTIATLVREMKRAGLLQWRYGRIVLLDRPALQALADAGIDRLAQRPARAAARSRTG